MEADSVVARLGGHGGEEAGAGVGLTVLGLGGGRGVVHDPVIVKSPRAARENLVIFDLKI